MGAVLGAAGNANADAIGDAAAKLSKAAYPFMKEVNWNAGTYALPAGSADPIGYAKAIGKMIDMGAQMDPKLPAYLMSQVKESDARAAYNALVEFAGVVKANPISASTPSSTVSGGGIDAAAAKLSDA